MTIQQAILIGAVIVGGSIIAARVIAPYEIASGTAVLWRVNTITGTVQLCNFTLDVGNVDAANRCR
jgi:hypothetical protein